MWRVHPDSSQPARDAQYCDKCHGELLVQLTQPQPDAEEQTQAHKCGRLCTSTATRTQAACELPEGHDGDCKTGWISSCSRDGGCVLADGHAGSCQTDREIDEQPYEVDGILEEAGGKFHVLWHGWADTTWEPTESLGECTEVVDHWEQLKREHRGPGPA